MTEADRCRLLVREICAEWNEDCEPCCDSYGHDENCRAIHIAAAKRALNAEVAALKHDIERHIRIAADLATECEERYRAGIEAAAKVCEAWRAGCDNRSMQAEGWASAECAIAIRALLNETAGE